MITWKLCGRRTPGYLYIMCTLKSITLTSGSTDNNSAQSVDPERMSGWLKGEKGRRISATDKHVISCLLKQAPSHEAVVARGDGIVGNEGWGSTRVFGSDAPLFADWRSDTSSEDFDLSSVESGSPSVGGSVASGCSLLAPKHQVLHRKLIDAPVDNTTGNPHTEDLVHLRNRVEQLESGMRDFSSVLSGLLEEVERLVTLVEGGEQRTGHRGGGSAPTDGSPAVEDSHQDIARSPVIFPAAETPCGSPIPDDPSRGVPVPTLVTRPEGLDENQRAFPSAISPGCGEQCVCNNISVENESDQTLVSQFTSAPKTFSSEHSSIRLHVRPGSLQHGQVAGPIIIHTYTGYIAECEGCAYLVSTAIDCQPSGSKFDIPLDLDFRVGANPDEHDTDVADGVNLEVYKASLRESYKVLWRHGGRDPWKPIGEENTDVVYECGMFFMRARMDHFSQGCLAKKIQLENAIHEDTVTWPSWAPPRKNQLGFVNATGKPLIFLVLPTSWSNQAILSVAMGLAFEGLEASAAISRAVQKSILTEATHPQVLQVPCTKKKGNPKVGQVFPFATCTLPKVTGSEARVALITANSDTVEVWDYRIVQQRTWVWVLPGQFSEGMLPLLGRHHRRDLAVEALCLMNIALMATAKGLQPTNRSAPISTVSSADVFRG